MGLDTERGTTSPGAAEHGAIWGKAKHCAHSRSELVENPSTNMETNTGNQRSSGSSKMKKEAQVLECGKTS